MSTNSDEAALLYNQLAASLIEVAVTDVQISRWTLVREKTISYSSEGLLSQTAEQVLESLKPVDAKIRDLQNLRTVQSERAEELRVELARLKEQR